MAEAKRRVGSRVCMIGPLLRGRRSPAAGVCRGSPELDVRRETLNGAVRFQPVVGVLDWAIAVKMLLMNRKRIPDPAALVDKVKRLPPDKLAEVEDFVDFLAQRTTRRLSQAASRLSELTFTKVWDNADDAAYDKL
jgi:hypothetical protein